MNSFYTATQTDRAINTKLWAEYFLRAAAEDDQWLYMLIDAAHDTRIFTALEECLHTRACLFSEDYVSAALKSASPFLLKIKTIDDFVMWCLQEGVHRHWMIFFTSPEIHVSEMKLHFKRFTYALGPDGKQYFFRYYDPRVLPIFLTAGDQRERKEFFRRCKTVWIPQVSPDGNIQFLQIDSECTPLMINYPTGQ